MDDRTAGICTNFLNGEGRCFLKGSFCDHPFDSEFNTCRKHGSLDHYRAEPHYDSDYEYMAPVEIRRAYGIDVGDIIADYFVPYSEIEKFKDPSMPIRQAREIVHDKLDQKGYRIAYGDMIVYRNCKIKLGNEEETGVYVCAKGS